MATGSWYESVFFHLQGPPIGAAGLYRGRGLCASPPADAAGLHHAVPAEPPPSAEQLLVEPDVGLRLDPLYDRYLAWKEELQESYGLEYYVQASLLPQWGAPHSGPALFDFISGRRPLFGSRLPIRRSAPARSPSRRSRTSSGPKSRRPLNRSAPGSDAAERLVHRYDRLCPADLYSYPTRRGRWLSATIGQYSFGTWDANQYAGNAQTNFVNYALAQNATQNYVSGDLGAYAEATAPAADLLFAGGFQGATNFDGSTITTRSLAQGKLAYFLPRAGRLRCSPAAPTASSGTRSRRSRRASFRARAASRSTRCRI